jgi:Ni/Co efflux regulator RcnB
MKMNLVRMVVLVVAAVTMAVPSFAAQTQSEREKALRQRSDTESAPGWQAAPSKETGSLPADDAKQMKSERGAKTEVPIYVIGGIVYRIGIDTP